MKFSIVTPTYNMARWLPETIESVLSQEGDFEIEYIVVDGTSTDETPQILKQYEQRVARGVYPLRCKKVSFTFFTLPPSGMYAAINAGLARATGDVYAWINSDDLYVPSALERMRATFETFPDIDWVKGTSALIDIDGTAIRNGVARVYRQDWLAQGIYGMQSYFVEQDSVFWRAALWHEIGDIPERLRYAGDYWLWIQFAKRHKMWTLNAATSCYRKRPGQLGMQVAKYKAEQRAIQGTPTRTARKVRLFFSPQSRTPSLSGLFLFLYPLVFGRPTEPDHIAIANGSLRKERSTTFVI